ISEWAQTGAKGPAMRETIRLFTHTSPELELLVAEDRHPGAALLDSVDLHLRAADHEVGVDGRDVQAAGSILFVDGERKTAAEGDVAGRVLVEQRVEECEPKLADLRRSVDERQLPEAGGALVGGDLRADDVRAQVA